MCLGCASAARAHSVVVGDSWGSGVGARLLRGIDGLLTAVHEWLKNPGGQLDCPWLASLWLAADSPGSEKLDWSCKLVDSKAANRQTRTSILHLDAPVPGRRPDGGGTPRRSRMLTHRGLAGQEKAGKGVSNTVERNGPAGLRHGVPQTLYAGSRLPRDVADLLWQ